MKFIIRPKNKKNYYMSICSSDCSNNCFAKCNKLGSCFCPLDR